MAFWNSTGKGKDVTETDSIIRRYTETAMHMLQDAQQEQQDVLPGTDQLAVKGKYASGGDAYWEAQYAAPDAMQQHGFCKTASQKYGSHGSQQTVKAAGDSLVPEAVPLGYDARFSTPALEINEEVTIVGFTMMRKTAPKTFLSHFVDYVGAPRVSLLSGKTLSDSAPVNLGSRYLDEEEAAVKGERIPVLDNRASVEKTVIDDIARKMTLRKISTLTALIERQKMGVPMQVNSEFA